MASDQPEVTPVATAAPNVADMTLVGDPVPHRWIEVSTFAGRFCGTCGVDEDDHDDQRRVSCVLY